MNFATCITRGDVAPKKNQLKVKIIYDTISSPKSPLSTLHNSEYKFKVFRSNSKFYKKFGVLWFEICSTDLKEILHTPRQLHCRDVCKFSLWSAENIMNKAITSFHWISNSIEISLVGRAPGLHTTLFIVTWHVTLCYDRLFVHQFHQFDNIKDIKIPHYPSHVDSPHKLLVMPCHDIIMRCDRHGLMILSTASVHWWREKHMRKTVQFNRYPWYKQLFRKGSAWTLSEYNLYVNYY